MRSLQRLALLATPVAASAIAIACLATPSAEPATADPASFSAARAIAELTEIADQPRPIGSAHHARVRDHLVDRLRSLGLEVQVQDGSAAHRFYGWIRGARVHNVIGILRGTGGGDPVVLAAHYDSRPATPGAADDGAGVATLLETARALASGPRGRGDVIVLFTDGEEVGLVGARLFVREHADVARARAVLNFEARGSGGPVAMFQTPPDNGDVVRQFAAAAPRPIGNSLLVALSKLLPNDTDMSVFFAAGMPGLNFAFADRLHHYHTPQDRIDNLDPGSVQQMGATALAITRELVGDAAGGRQGGRVVYFDLLGRVVLYYPEWLALPLAIATAALVWACARRWLAARRGRAVLAGAAVQVVTLFAVVGAAVAAGVLLHGQVPARAIMSGSKLVAGGVLLITGSIWAGLLALAARRIEPAALAVGGLAMWAAVGAVLAAVAPGASYLFTWGPVCGGLAGLAVFGAGQRLRGAVVIVGGLALAVAAALFAETVYALAIMDAGMTPVVPATFALCGLASAAPAVLGAPAGVRRWLPVVAAGAGIALLAVAAATLEHGDRVPRMTTRAYALDADTGAAAWLISAGDPAARSLSASGEARLAPGAAYPIEPAARRYAAPAIALASPEVEILGEQPRPGGSGRSIRVRARSTRGASCLELWQVDGPPIVGTRVDGTSPASLVRFSPDTDAWLYDRMMGGDPAPGWKLAFCGAGTDGVVIDVDTASGGPVSLRIADQSPALPPSPALPDRPRDLIPGFDGDVTRVSRLVQLSATATPR